MNSSTSVERGYLLLADISGSIQFISDSEIEHANEIIRELLEFLISKLSPAFNVAQIDGDAIFAFAPEERIIRGESVIELVESIYTLYKDQLIQVSRVRTCQCNACRNTAKLDLKFALHFGEYIQGKNHKHFDLTGLAPHFIRKREWKDPVKESVNWRGYSLFTESCLSRLNLHPDNLELIEIKDGTIRTFGLNLESRYKSTLEQRRVFIDEYQATNQIQMGFPISPIELWNWINDPDQRTKWYGLRWKIYTRENGRTKAGSVNHCFHGIGDTLETILDWRPFEYYTSEYRIRPFNIRIQQTSIFTAHTDNTTKLTLHIKPEKRDAGKFVLSVCNYYAKYEMSALKRLENLINKT